MIPIKDIKLKIINSTNLWARQELGNFNKNYIYFITLDNSLMVQILKINLGFLPLEDYILQYVYPPIISNPIRQISH